MFGNNGKLLFIAIVCFVNFACKNQSSEESKLIQLFETNAVQSGTAIEQSTRHTLHSLENRSEEPSYSEITTPWFKKAEQIYTDADLLIRKFKNFRLDNTNKNQQLTALYEDLQKFRKEYETTDSIYLLNFNKEFLFIKQVFQQIGINTTPNGEVAINAIEDPELSAGVALVENNIKMLLNNIVTYCFLKTNNTHSIGPDFYSSIVGQNAQIFEPGSTLEIYAGVGAFSKSSKPTILINGNQTPLNDMGYAKFKSKTPKTPGNYTMPVQISFFNQLTGKDEVKQVTIEYKVVKPCD